LTDYIVQITPVLNHERKGDAGAIFEYIEMETRLEAGFLG